MAIIPFSDGDEFGHIRVDVINANFTELDSRVTALQTANSGDQIAASVPFTPTGTGLLATHVQAAIAELAGSLSGAADTGAIMPTESLFTTTTTGTGTLTLAGLTSKVTTATFYEYHTRDASGQYEQAWGILIISGGTTTITRTAIGKSSSGDGVAVPWSAGTKKVTVYNLDSNLLGAARLVLNLQPWQDVIVLSSGQSNANAIATAGSEAAVVGGVTAHPNVLGFMSNTPTSAASSQANTPGSNMVWMTINPSQTTTNFFGSINNGYCGMYCNDNGNAQYEFCKRLATATGHRVRLILLASSGTGFEDASFGWVYDGNATPGRCCNKIKAYFDDAMTKMVAADPRQTGNTKAHIMIWMHTESAAGSAVQGGGLSSSKYGKLLGTWIRQLENPSYFGICNERTLYLATEAPPMYRERDAAARKFNGLAVTKRMIGDRFRIVSTSLVQTQQDRTHYTGAGQVEIGSRLWDAFSLPNVQQSIDTAFRLARRPSNVTVFGVPFEDFVSTIWDGTGVPSASTKTTVTTAGTIKMRVGQLDSILGTTNLFTTAGLDAMMVGDELRLFKTTESLDANNKPTNYKRIIVTSVPVLVTGAANYYEFNATVTDVGSLAGWSVGNQMFLQPVSFRMHPDDRMQVSTDAQLIVRDGIVNEAIAAGTENKIAGTSSPHVTQGSGLTTHLVAATASGEAFRTNEWTPIYIDNGQSLNATPLTIATIAGMADGDHWAVEVEIHYQHAVSLLAGKFRVNGAGFRTGGTMNTSMATAIETVANPSAVPNPSIGWATAGGNYGFNVTVTGLAATIKWKARIRVRKL